MERFGTLSFGHYGPLGGGRMLTEETYVCLWNVLDSIPSLDDASKSVKQQTWAFNDEWRSNSKGRLIDRDRRILDASDLGFNVQDRLELMRLLATPGMQGPVVAGTAILALTRPVHVLRR